MVCQNIIEIFLGYDIGIGNYKKQMIYLKKNVLHLYLIKYKDNSLKIE